MWAAIEAGEAEPSGWQLVIAVVLLFLAFYGLASIFRSVRRGARALHVANRNRLEAKVAAGADADAGADARAAAGVDVGGIHLHGIDGERRASRNLDYDDRTGTLNYDDELYLDERTGIYEYNDDRTREHDYDRARATEYDRTGGARSGGGFERSRSRRSDEGDSSGLGGPLLGDWSSNGSGPVEGLR